MPSPAPAPTPSPYWWAWAVAAAVLNAAIGAVAALPLTWAAAAVISLGGGAAMSSNQLMTAGVVIVVSLAVLIPLFILANRALRRLLPLPARAYWPLAIVIALLPAALLAL